MHHFFQNYYYWGMHIVWWFLWVCLLIWIFAIPFDLPGQRRAKGSALDILKKRFASGEITKEEYRERKKILENE